MKFTKMQGLGNDYVYLDCTQFMPDDLPKLAKLVSDRHWGVGSDGLICICPSQKGDFFMDMYNADGSRGTMCGNGVRCVGKFVYDKGLTTKTTVEIETLGGMKTLYLTLEDGMVDAVTVDMGSPKFQPSEVPLAGAQQPYIAQSIEVAGQAWEMTCLSMGNPHAVVFVPQVDTLDLETIGPMFERHSLFPEGVNTEFVQVVDESTLKMRVWERGSGETMACGTGACATVVAAALTKRAESTATVQLPGGDLDIRWDRETDKVWMTGPAVTVFEGEFHPRAFKGR